MTLNAQQIEDYAKAIFEIDIDFSHTNDTPGLKAIIESYAANGLELIKHLDHADQGAVLQRYSEMLAGIDKEAWNHIAHLAYATGCPADVSAIDWLFEQDLIRIIDGQVCMPRLK
jgi:hypothetical protein